MEQQGEQQKQSLGADSVVVSAEQSRDLKLGGEPQMTRLGLLDCQVCVPENFTDDQVLEFAEREYRCGTTHGWQIRRQGDPHLSGCEERVKCEGRAGFVHIMLDA